MSFLDINPQNIQFLSYLYGPTGNRQGILGHISPTHKHSSILEGIIMACMKGAKGRREAYTPVRQLTYHRPIKIKN